MGTSQEMEMALAELVAESKLPERPHCKQADSASTSSRSRN
jgi:hypothetical protein